MADSKLSALSELSAPTLDDLAYVVDDPAGTPASYKLSLTRLLGLAGVLPGGRLTLESGVPFSTTDQTAKTNIYYTPDASDFIRLYDGTRVREYTFTERTYALGTLTSGRPYDQFMYDNAGTLTLEGLAWTSGTTRATALAWQAGLGLVKSGDPTRLYLGTFYTASTTTTAQSESDWLLWNAYNQRKCCVRKLDSTSHTNSSGTLVNWRSSSTSTLVTYCTGLPSVACLKQWFRADGSGANVVLYRTTDLLTDDVSTQMFNAASSMGQAPYSARMIRNPVGYHSAISRVANFGSIATLSECHTEVEFWG